MATCADLGVSMSTAAQAECDERDFTWSFINAMYTSFLQLPSKVFRNPIEPNDEPLRGHDFFFQDNQRDVNNEEIKSEK